MNLFTFFRTLSHLLFGSTALTPTSMSCKFKKKTIFSVLLRPQLAYTHTKQLNFYIFKNNFPWRRYRKCAIRLWHHIKKATKYCFHSFKNLQSETCSLEEYASWWCALNASPALLPNICTPCCDLLPLSAYFFSLKHFSIPVWYMWFILEMICSPYFSHKGCTTLIENCTLQRTRL